MQEESKSHKNVKSLKKNRTFEQVRKQSRSNDQEIEGEAYSESDDEIKVRVWCEEEEKRALVVSIYKKRFAHLPASL